MEPRNSAKKPKTIPWHEIEFFLVDEPGYAKVAKVNLDKCSTVYTTHKDVESIRVNIRKRLNERFAVPTYDIEIKKIYNKPLARYELSVHLHNSSLISPDNFLKLLNGIRLKAEDFKKLKNSISATNLISITNPVPTPLKHVPQTNTPLNNNLGNSILTSHFPEYAHLFSHHNTHSFSSIDLASQVTKNFTTNSEDPFESPATNVVPTQTSSSSPTSSSFFQSSSSVSRVSPEEVKKTIELFQRTQNQRSKS
ncbi:MAG: hypothetical protein H0W64_00190 [Gammaproteobacteria bacterium]|nr:hypothetical protein [Gammaproteobacteria bacterium]